MNTGLTEASLRRLYVDLRKTDSEIAEFFGVDRTTIVHQRKNFHILTRKSTGTIGEEMVEKELRSRGYEVKNMNEVDKLHPFDLLVDGHLRIEVKTAIETNQRFYITLSEKASNDNKVSDTRVRLRNGRTMKVFTKTCDLLICVGLEKNGDCHFFLMDPKVVEGLGSFGLPLNPFAESKYNKLRENWGLINEKKSDVGASDSKISISL